MPFKPDPRYCISCLMVLELSGSPPEVIANYMLAFGATLAANYGLRMSNCPHDCPIHNQEVVQATIKAAHEVVVRQILEAAHHAAWN